MSTEVSLKTGALPLEYVAGLFDGEGWFSIGRQRAPRIRREFSFQLHAAIVMRERFILEKLQEQFGGTIQTQKVYSDKHSPTFRWHINGVDCLKFLDQVEPYLLAKRKPAAIARKFQEEKNRHGNRPLSDEQYAFREQCYEEMKMANKKGIGK